MTLSKRDKVKPGDVWSRHSHGEVIARHGGGGGGVRVRNASGFEWDVAEEIIEKEFSFADQFRLVDKYSRTAVIEALTDNPRRAMTICFSKKVDPKDVAKVLAGGQREGNAREWNKLVKLSLEGEQRIMVGYHSNRYDEHRRLHFQEHGKGPRLVDPRTIKWMIVNQHKYVVKA